MGSGPLRFHPELHPEAYSDVQSIPKRSQYIEMHLLINCMERR